MRGDLAAAELSEKELRLLEVCGQITTAAYRLTDAQVQELRDLDWAEEEIAEAVLITALFAMFNRVADAFGLVDPGYLDSERGAQPATSYQKPADSE